MVDILVYSIAAPMVNYVFQLKPSPAIQAPGYCHQLGLAYGPTNTLSATVAFLLLPDANLLPQAGITHYSQLHDSERLKIPKTDYLLTD